MCESSPASSARCTEAGSAASSPSAAAASRDRRRDRDTEVLARLPQLSMDVLPLTDPQVVQELLTAHPAERVAGALALLLAQVGPQAEVGQEVAGRVTEARVQLVGLRLLVDRAFARVLDRQRRRDDEDLVDDSLLLRLEHHATEPRVEGKPREPASGLGEGHDLAGLERAELAEQLDAVGDVARVRRLDEREAGDLAEAERGHLQDHRREVGPQDLRLGELRAARRNAPRSRGGCRCRRRRGRTGRTAGSPTPARWARWAGAAP